jgi:hypothetical protein
MSSAKLSQSLSNALQDMIEERARLDDAIEKLQSFVDQPVVKQNYQSSKSNSTTEGKTVRRRWTAEGRKAAAERMRRYWASRRKANDAGSANVKKGKKQKDQPAEATSSRSKSWSPTARKEAAERMRRYWADRRKAAAAE